MVIETTTAGATAYLNRNIPTILHEKSVHLSTDVTLCHHFGSANVTLELNGVARKGVILDSLTKLPEYSEERVAFKHPSNTPHKIHFWQTP